MLAIKELLKFSLEDTEISLLRILSKSISKFVKRFEACPKSGREGGSRVFRCRSSVDLLLFFIWSNTSFYDSFEGF